MFIKLAIRKIPRIDYPSVRREEITLTNEHVPT